MKRTVAGCIDALLFSILTAAVVWAQATAQISGSVRDQSGAVLPGVEITATQTDTGIVRTSITNETGSYVLPNLVTGPYRLEAALPGFRTYVQTGIILQVNSNPVINPVLAVGQVSEQVEVQANAALVETRATGVGQVIENERILELPLNGRQVTDLITLSGAAVNTSTPSSNSRVIKGRASVAVAGGFGWSVAYTLDGVTHNDPYDNLSLPFPFPDALQEFKVETGGSSSQGGMHTGAAVTSVTKSGTNELHGGLFEFVRNDLFNARNYFALTHNTLKRNQFGGTLGGPIIKNKVFFFGGYQGTTVREDPGNNQAFVPTAAMMAGDFTAAASPACNTGRQATFRAPFVDNRVDPSLLSKAALNIASKLRPATDQCGLVTYGVRNVENNHQAVGKVDYQISDKQSLFGRVILTPNKIANPFEAEGGNLLNTISPGYDNLGQSYAIGDTYLVGPSMVNAVRLAVNRTAINRMSGKYFEPKDVGIGVYSSVPNYTQLSITGGFNIGGSGPAVFRTTTYQLTDDVSLVRGTHQLSFGANLALWRSNGYAQRRPPTLLFDGSVTSSGVGDFLLGKLRNLDQSATLELIVQEWYLGLYGQDTWKVTPRLTLNYGIRWEPFLPQVFKKGNGAYTFDHDRFLKGIKSTVYKNAPSGVYYSGDPGSPGNAVSNKRWMDFGPRVGLAWDPRADGRMSIRASYAMSFERQTLAYRQTTATNPPPWGARIQLESPLGGLDNPWQGYPGGNPFPLTLDANSFFPAFGIFTSTPWDISPTTVHAWDLSIQKQIASDWLLSTSYLGRQISHVWTGRELNYGIYFPGSCTLQGVPYNPCSTNANLNQRRRFSFERPEEATAFGGVNEIDDGGTQSYNGMLLSIQRSAGSSATVSGNYTWSHCIGMPGNGTGGPDPGSGYVDFNNRNFDRGNCEADRRHVFNITGVAETPQFSNPTLHALATGWRFSGIYKRASGEYLTIVSGQDRALTGMSNQRPNQILENPYLDKSGRPNTQYLNPAAFAQPALGTLGNMGRGNVEGPGVWQFDAALSRIFRFRETQRLEFRAEAYNLLNHFQPSSAAPLSGGASPVVTTNINTVNTFGQIRTAGDPRILQFALKYVF